MTSPPAPSIADLRRRRSAWRAVALVSAALLGLVGVTGVALAVGRTSLGAAMDQRIDERADLVAHFHRAADVEAGNDTFVTRIREADFSPTEPGLNVVQLLSFVSNRGGDEIRHKMIVRHDGTVVGALPADLDIPAGVLDDALAASEAGTVGLSPVFELDDDLYWARTYPVAGEDPWGSLVMVEPLATGATQGLYERLGALSPGEGGLTLLDPDGVAAVSWDRSRIGTRPFTPAELRSLGAEPRVWTTDVDGERIVRIGVGQPESPIGYGIVFEQSERELFGDLRRAQDQRDHAVLVAAAVAVLALMAFTAVRQRSVRRSEARVELLMRNAHDVILVVDRQDRLSFVSPATCTMLDQDPADWLGRPLSHLVAPEHVDDVLEAVAQARETGQASLLGVHLRAGDGGFRWFDLTLSDRRDPNVAGVLLTCQEVGDRKRLEDQLSYQAGHDPLTGLANRTRFEAALTELAAGDRPVTVMVVDLDRFKQLNDTLGHAAGDAALKAVAEGLCAAVREGDVVGRLGGDEFGVVVPDVTEDTAVAVAERMAAAVRAVWSADDAVAGLDASIGIAMAVGPLHRPLLVVRDADAAMYEAKRAGGGRIVTVAVGPQAPPARPAGDDPSTPPRSAPDDGGDGTVDDPAPSAGPAASDPDPVPVSAPSVGARLRSAAAVVLTSAVVVGLAGVGVAESARAQRVSEERRLDERAALVENLGEAVAATTSPELMLELVATTPWDPDSQPMMDYIVRAYALSPGLGSHGMTAALRPSGEVMAVYPPTEEVLVDTTDAWWAGALRGEPYSPALVNDGEHDRYYLVVPRVAPDGSVDLIAVIGMSPAESDWSATYIGMGAIGGGSGGASTLDSNGVAIAAWDPALVGEQVIDPAQLHGVGRGEVAVRRDRVDGVDMVTLITPVPTRSSLRYSVWRQPADEMFGDLRAGQAARDVAVFGLLAVAVCGLALINRRRELALRRNAARLDALLQQANDLVLVVDDAGRVRFSSAAVHRLFGRRPSEVVGRPLEALAGRDPADRVLAAARTAPDVGGRRLATVQDVEVAAPDGTVALFDVDGVDLRHEQGVGGFLLTFHEISARKQLQDRLTAQATHDALTGLPNRTQFTVRLDELAHRREPTGDHAVVFVDLDHFKPVNDRFGHEAGDQLLRIVARRLTNVVRATDVVCRLGGDEFAILLADCNEEQARETVRRLQDVVRQPVAVSGNLVAVDASIGVALSRPSIDHPEQLVREADQAMYEAKRSGRGRFVVGG